MLAAILMAAAMTGQPIHRITYEEIRDVTMEVVDYDDIYTRGRNKLSVDVSFRLYHKGKNRPACTDSTELNLTFISKSTTWEFLQFNDAVLLYDGERRRLTPSKETHDVCDGFVMEFFHFPITLAGLEAVGRAKDVKLAVGSTNFPIEAEAIREYCRRLRLDAKALKADAERREDERAAGVERERLAREAAAKAKAEESAKAEREKHAAAKAKAEAEAVAKADKAARTDLEMARKFVKLRRNDTAKGYVERALGRNPSEETREAAEALLATLD